MHLRVVAAGAATLTVREWGEPGGTPLLFWHSVGPGGSGAMLDVAAGPLAEAGFHVIAPDELTHARPSESWPAIATARIPTLLLLAGEPEDVREANELLLPRFLDGIPQAEVARPGCRHQVFADLGARSGDVVVEWLQRQGIA